MRILHIDAGREMRGGQWQALYLLRGLRAAGHEQTLLSPDRSPLAARAAGEGIPVCAASLLAAGSVMKDADIVHAHDARGHTLAAGMGRTPLVVSRRVAFPVRRSAVSRWKYARAGCYIAVSRFVRACLLDAGVPEHKIDVVYDGVPVAEPATGGQRIVAPASDDPRKGTDLAARAAAIAGITLEFSRNLVADLRDAALFVYITEMEGLGSAALLAMAAGVPVVASAVGGLPEIVVHERTGLLTPNDPHAIAAAIRRLMDDRALACSIGARGRQAVCERFSTERMVTDTVQVYQKALG